MLRAQRLIRQLLPNTTSGDIKPDLGPASKAAQAALDVPRFPKLTYSYGTAGFRGPADTLPSVMLRCGMLAAVRSLSVGVGRNGQQLTVGVMVTASHNPVKDNGVKLVDPHGEMMAMDWEDVSTRLANADENNVCEVLKAIIASKVPKLDPNTVPQVFVGRDNRPSSLALSSLVIRGVESLGGQTRDLGVLTTPQLHWCVRRHNEGKEATVEAYARTLASAFKAVTGNTRVSPVHVDCANGVGSGSLNVISPLLTANIEMRQVNNGGGTLNLDCGADFVQKNRKLPLGLSPQTDNGKKCASFDGDADRLIYYYLRKDEFRLLDGDKIVALVVKYLSKLIREARLNSLSLGVVQTAYANGASTTFITDTLKADAQCAKTGVKHLHPKAEGYDVGVYFEANGHGTVLFSDRAIANFNGNSSFPGAQQALDKLRHLVDLINQCVGDAVSDLLLVEAAMVELGWNLEDWDRMYEDFPSRMEKVVVKDRSVVKTTNAERTCTAPVGLQERINELVGNKSKMRRSFVRASGTEDIVRVYAEAETREKVEQLTEAVCGAVKELCS